jgi:nitroimidazol reductase NimA-like FMN-containing flavoprotein (pyridoxamine 5'-phosphate oxidase superfamily)
MQMTINDYPQLPPFTQAEIEIFLSKSLIARLGTINEDGTIHLTPIYFKYENNEFILGTQDASRRVRNIQRNPNVTLLIDDTNSTYQAVMVYGKAGLDHEDVLQKRTAILERYEPKDEAIKSAQGLCQRWSSVIIHIKPDRFVSFDYTKASLINF